MMLKYAIVFCIISFCHSAGRQPGKYTQLVFGQRLSNTFFYDKMNWQYMEDRCDKYKNYIANHDTMFYENRWIIAGLWAFDSGAKFHTACVDALENRIELKGSLLGDDLRRNLTKHWPVLTVDQNTEGNWAIDYSLFGSCVTDNAVSYFQKALELMDKYNAGSILSNAGISPGGIYDLDHIISVFTNKFETRVNVRCLHPENTRNQYLLDVEICFDKNFDNSDNLENCQYETYTGNRNQCFLNVKVHYPFPLYGYL